MYLSKLSKVLVPFQNLQDDCNVKLNLKTKRCGSLNIPPDRLTEAKVQPQTPNFSGRLGRWRDVSGSPWLFVSFAGPFDVSLP